MKRMFLFASLAVIMAGCCGGSKAPALIPASGFEGEVGSKPVALYNIGGGDLTVQITNFGGRVVSMFVPDKKGSFEDVVLGHETLDEYVNFKGERFLGACVGPVANRLGGAGFTVDGVRFSTPCNDNGVNTLHGGFVGVDMVPWDVVRATADSLVLHLLCPDGFEGYPGNLEMTMTYSVSGSVFSVDYEAVTDKATPVNFTHHPFFNLRGEGTIESYIMEINASAYTPIDSLSIPLGYLSSVEGTPFDFREAHAIGDMIGCTDNDQIRNARGYDHNWVIDSDCCESVRFDCSVWDPESGRCLEVWSDQPGLQFYSGNFFDGSYAGKYGRPMEFRGSLALETQHFPDTPNNPSFGDITLRPGEVYTHHCEYRFSVR